MGPNIIPYISKFLRISFTILLTSLSFSSSAQENSFEKMIIQLNKLWSDGKYPEGLEIGFNALAVAEKNHNCIQISIADLNIGKIQYVLGQREKAIYFFRNVERLSKECYIDSIASKAYYNMGAIYSELAMLDSSFYFLNRSKEIYKRTANYIGLSRVFSVIADIQINHHYNKGETQRSIDSAVFFAQKSGDASSLNFSKTKQGIFYSQTNESQKAFKIYNELLADYELSRNLEGQKYILNLMTDELLKDSQAKKSLSRLIHLKDSIFGLDIADKVAAYQIKYESEKKENLNKILQQENMLNQAKINTRNRTIILLVISILLIVLLIIWRINVINLRKKQEELLNAQKLQQEKERISRDLHDNVGGQLSFVLLSLEGLTDEQKEKREEVVKSINESVRQVIGNLRETIWAISDEQITIQDLSDKLKVYARNIFRHSNVQVKFQEHINNNISMNALVGLNLFRICQEIINNSFKHSKANLLEVSISSDKNITIIIADNGKGLPENVNSEGYGFSNIKKRAEETGISVLVESAENKGVKYTLVV